MITESQLWHWMREGQYPPLIEEIGALAAHRMGIYGLNRRAYATLARDYGKFKAGTRIKVVMASRLGDVGITDVLEADHGYSDRVTCVESEFGGLTLQPAELLIGIEPLEDDAERVAKAFPDGCKEITDYEVS